MLGLSRKSGQQIRIGDNVFATVLEIHGITVSIGIEAPREMRIRRLELPRVVSATAIDARRPIVSSLPPTIVNLSG